MNAKTDDEQRPLMEHLLKERHPHSPRISHQGDIIDRCLCTEKSNSLSTYYLNRSRKERLVVYVRVDREENLETQLDLIKKYCSDFGYHIADVYTDVADHPSFGFKAALDAMENADGLITVDLNQFVSANGDRVRELRPLIHHFFCQGGKHLITVNDGIDTGTECGQQNAIEAVSGARVGNV